MMNDLTHFYISDSLVEPLIKAQITQNGLKTDSYEVLWNQIFSHNFQFNKWMVKAYFKLNESNLISEKDFKIIRLSNEVIQQVFDSNYLSDSSEFFKVIKLLDSLKSHYQSYMNKNEINHNIKKCLIHNQNIIDQIKKLVNFNDIKEKLKLLLILKDKEISSDNIISFIHIAENKILIIENKISPLYFDKFSLYLKEDKLIEGFNKINQGVLKENRIENLKPDSVLSVDKFLLSI